MNFDKPIYFVFNKADLSAEKEINDIIIDANDILKSSGFLVAGLSAYSSKENKHYGGDNIIEYINKIEEKNKNLIYL